MRGTNPPASPQNKAPRYAADGCKHVVHSRYFNAKKHCVHKSWQTNFPYAGILHRRSGMRGAGVGPTSSPMPGCGSGAAACGAHVYVSLQCTCNSNTGAREIRLQGSMGLQYRSGSHTSFCVISVSALFGFASRGRDLVKSCLQLFTSSKCHRPTWTWIDKITLTRQSCGDEFFAAHRVPLCQLEIDLPIVSPLP